MNNAKKTTPHSKALAPNMNTNDPTHILAVLFQSLDVRLTLSISKTKEELFETGEDADDETGDERYSTPN